MRRIISGFLFLVMMASVAQGTTMLALSLKELTDNADAVVIGRCTGKRVFKSGNMIYTEYIIQVEETIKGSVGRELKVVQPGGELGGKGVRVSGVARLSLQEDALLFLEKENQGHRGIVGWSQGKFHIYYDEQSKKKYARQELDGLGFAKRGSGEVAAAKAEKLELEKLKTEVRALAAQDKGVRK